MIRIFKQKYAIDRKFFDVIQERMSKETCKTNINPQLLFIQGFTGHTFKTFVGNWTKKGFWISKFRLQLMQLRPDVITRFSFIEDSENYIVTIRYSIGFSSLFLGLIGIGSLSIFFAIAGLVGYVIGVVFIIGYYIILSSIELTRIRVKIFELLLHDIPRKRVK